jgi:hypothetical protein
VRISPHLNGISDYFFDQILHSPVSAGQLVLALKNIDAFPGDSALVYNRFAPVIKKLYIGRNADDVLLDLNLRTPRAKRVWTIGITGNGTAYGRVGILVCRAKLATEYLTGKLGGNIVVYSGLEGGIVENRDFDGSDVRREGRPRKRVYGTGGQR